MNKPHRYLSKAITALKRINLPYKQVPLTAIPDDSFFPGMTVDRGVLKFHAGTVHPGELLHEAGHLALYPKQKWYEIKGTFPSFDPFPTGFPFGDLAVEAWSAALAVSVGIPIAVHTSQMGNADRHNDDGKGVDLADGYASFAGFNVAEQLMDKKHVGITFLAVMGMTDDWPNMRRWYWRDRPCMETEPFMDALLSVWGPQKFARIFKLMARGLDDVASAKEIAQISDALDRFAVGFGISRG